MSTPAPGDLLAGKYRVERVLGVGGMGVVVLATHLNLEQKVAIKLLLPEALQNAEALRRFLQEAKAAARLRGDHVVRVHDVGTLDNGNPFLVMEYLEGEDLETVLHGRGRLPAEEAADYVLQACEAIAEAHGAGIVHRDLKPANLFLTTLPDGTRSIKVLDFGISKIAPRHGGPESVTKTRALMGSPLYMSPEQMKSTKTVTAKADVWALGVILYELVVGAPPFMAETMPQICAMVLTEPLPALESVCPGAPPAVAAAIDLATRKDPGDRCDVAGLARALHDLASPAGRMSVDRVIRVSQVSSATLLSEGLDVATGARVSSLPSLHASLRPGSVSGKTSVSVSGPTSWSGSGSHVSILDAGGDPPSQSTGPNSLSHIPNRPATLSTFGTTAPTLASRARPALWAATALACAGMIGAALYMGLRRPVAIPSAGAASALAAEGPSSPAVTAQTASSGAAPSAVEPPATPPATGLAPEPPPFAAAPAATGSASDVPAMARPPTTSTVIAPPHTAAAQPSARPLAPVTPRASSHPPQKPQGSSDDPYDHRFSP